MKAILRDRNTQILIVPESNEEELELNQWAKRGILVRQILESDVMPPMIRLETKL